MSIIERIEHHEEILETMPAGDLRGQRVSIIEKIRREALVLANTKSNGGDTDQIEERINNLISQI